MPDNNKKRYIVIGGTGSLGSAVVKMILAQKPGAEVVVLSRDEYKQWKLSRSLCPQHPGKLTCRLGNIKNYHDVARVLKPGDVVINTAALKHLKNGEDLAGNQFVETNITGLQNIITAAADKGVACLVHISSDKAVKPVSLYGATKLAAEKLMLQAATEHPNTRFVVLRFGNIWASRGSLGEYLLTQPNSVVLNHPEATRFFISEKEASEAVIKYAEAQLSQAIVIPKCKAFRIADVVKQYAPAAKLIEGRLTVGEKIHETLWSDAEGYAQTETEDAYVLKPKNGLLPSERASQNPGLTELNSGKMAIPGPLEIKLEPFKR